MIAQKWVCNKCGHETLQRPDHKNATCTSCGRGRYQAWNKCDCGNWFHPEKTKQKFCSKECSYQYRESGGKLGKHYPHLQRARIATCPVCGQQFRAVCDYKSRRAVYCSKECWSHRGKKYKKVLDRSPEFISWKKAVFKRDKYTCQVCGATKTLEAHHIKEKLNFPELKYDVSNGVCLCHECHKKTDNYGQRARNKKAVLLNDSRSDG